MRYSLLFSIILCSIISIIGANLNARSIKPLANDQYFIIGENVNIREESNVNSKVALQLQFGSIVRLIKRTNTVEKIGEQQGEWYFVETGHRKKNSKEKIQGWVFNYFLSNLNEFRLVEKFNHYVIENSVGDMGFRYEIFDNGKYISKRVDLSTGQKVTTNGLIYRYRNVIFAQPNELVGGMLFLLKNNGELCSQFGPCGKIK